MSNRESNFVKIIKEICQEEGIEISCHIYDWVFELEKGAIKNSIYGYQFGINSATSALICSDKVAASHLLMRYEVPAVLHHLFITPKLLGVTDEKQNWSRIKWLLDRHKTLVCKPNDGTGGDNVFKVVNPTELEQVTHKILSTANAMAVSVFEDIEFEYRVVVLDGKMRLAFYKEVPAVIGDGEKTLHQLTSEYILENSNAEIPRFSKEELSQVLPKGVKKRVNWKHNLGQGSTPHLVEDENMLRVLSALAVDAASVLGINFASVDIIKTAEGLKILEVNSGVMLESFSRENRRCYEIAKGIYREAILLMLK